MPRKKTPKFQSLTGMHDILPEDQKYFHEIYKTAKNIADFYGFGEITTPILEQAELFSRGVGMATDVVKKQMYTFRTKGGELVTLRPEGTASIVRAYIEHGMRTLPQPVKLWYFGPFFRYEKPQGGRYRQFWQFGFEIIGDASPVEDAQVILIFYKILEELKLKNLIIQINSIGDHQCRPYYKRLLGSYLRAHHSSLCADCRRRIKENPLRVLDCKEEKCQSIINSAPQILDHLCRECHDHFKEVLEYLDNLGLPYHLNPYLVRGLDYYTRTVFEIFAEQEEFQEVGDQESKNNQEKKEGLSVISKNALAGGGRYDTLVKLLGGKETPAFGAAGGVERIVEAMKFAKIKLARAQKPKIFLAQLGKQAKREILRLIEEFRQAKVPVAFSLSKDSLKSQLKLADRLGVKYTLILGQKEVVEGKIIIRNMQTGKQKTTAIKTIVQEMKKKISK
ncbi:MAG TPA: histidine--tRNA ligase [bacterium]|nr:histidine--tRNA ligase [bacterium]